MAGEQMMPVQSNGTSLNSSSDVERMQKVKALKESIRNGTYSVNTSKIAEKLVESGMLDARGKGE